MSEESKPWNEQLIEWFKASGKTVTEIVKETGIPDSTFRDYLSKNTTRLDRIPVERLNRLYQLTSLECFRYSVPKIDIKEPEKFSEGKYDGKTISEIARHGKESIDDVVGKTTSQLTGMQRLEAGLLKAQLYQPTPQQRAAAIIELLDVLSEEVDYFRTASSEEKKVLIERLQREPESFGYVSQMLNVIYSGKGIESWMLLAQPPSKIKRILKNGK